MIAIDLSKQKGLDANPGAMQPINFTGNLAEDGNTMFSIIKEAKKPFETFKKEL